MKNNIFLAGYDSQEVDTLEICTDEPHHHIHMGDYHCTQCGCDGFKWSGSYPPPNDATCERTSCGHTYANHDRYP